jgi:NADH-quinone oxidoreductase subunit H
VEYGGMKWSLFFMAEYLHMTTASGMVAAIFLGGWQMIPGMPFLLNLLQLQGDVLYWATVGLQVLSFVLKVVFLMIFFIVVRFTLPRFRYDQLMHLGWKILVPISLVNIVVTAFLIAYGVY